MSSRAFRRRSSSRGFVPASTGCVAEKAAGTIWTLEDRHCSRLLHGRQIGLNAWFSAEEPLKSEESPRTDEPRGGANEDVEQNRVAVTVNQCSGSY